MKHLTSYVKYNESVEDLSIELITDLISNDVEDNFDYSTIKECYYKEKKDGSPNEVNGFGIIKPGILNVKIIPEDELGPRNSQLNPFSISTFRGRGICIKNDSFKYLSTLTRSLNSDRFKSHSIYGDIFKLDSKLGYILLFYRKKI